MLSLSSPASYKHPPQTSTAAATFSALIPPKGQKQPISPYGRELVPTHPLSTDDAPITELVPESVRRAPNFLPPSTFPSTTRLPSYSRPCQTCREAACQACGELVCQAHAYHGERAGAGEPNGGATRADANERECESGGGEEEEL